MKDKLFVVLNGDDPDNITIECLDIVDVGQLITPRGYHPSDGLPPVPALVRRFDSTLTVSLGVDAADCFDIALRLALRCLNKYADQVLLHVIADCAYMEKDDNLVNETYYWHEQAKWRSNCLAKAADAVFRLMELRRQWLMAHPEEIICPAKEKK